MKLTEMRKNLLKQMHAYVIEMGDEKLYMDWITLGVPDEPSEDDFDFIAGSDEEWVYICKLFGKLVIAEKEENER